MSFRAILCLLIPITLLTGCQLNRSLMPWSNYVNAKKKEKLLAEIELGLAQQQAATMKPTARGSFNADSQSPQSSMSGQSDGSSQASGQLLVFRSVEEDLKQADIATNTENLELARSYYRRVLQQQPSHVLAHHRLGIIADRQKRYQDATNHYFAALSHQPDNADVLSDLGYSYFLQGKPQECENHLKRAVEISPHHRIALSNLGLLYSSQGDHDLALAMFKKAGSETNEQSRLDRLMSMFTPEKDATDKPVQQTKLTTEQLKQQMEQARLASIAKRNGTPVPSAGGYSNSANTAVTASDPNIIPVSSQTPANLQTSGPDITQQIKAQMEQARLAAIAERRSRSATHPEQQLATTEIIKYNSHRGSAQTQHNHTDANGQMHYDNQNQVRPTWGTEPPQWNQPITQVSLQTPELQQPQQFNQVPQYASMNSDSQDPLQNMPSWPPTGIQSRSTGQNQVNPADGGQFENRQLGHRSSGFVSSPSSQVMPAGGTQSGPTPQGQGPAQASYQHTTAMPSGFISTAQLEQARQAALVGMSMGQRSVMPFADGQLVTPNAPHQNFPAADLRTNGFQYQPVQRELPGQTNNSFVHGSGPSQQQQMDGSLGMPQHAAYSSDVMNQQLQNQQRQLSQQNRQWSELRQQVDQNRQMPPSPSEMVARMQPTQNYNPQQWQVKQYSQPAMGNNLQPSPSMPTNQRPTSQNGQQVNPTSGYSTGNGVNPFSSQWSN